MIKKTELSSELNNGGLVSLLRLSGFVDISDDSEQIQGLKPDYEPGSTVKLNLPFSSVSQVGLGSTNQAKMVWKVSANEMDDDVELIDDDDLLDEADKQPPDPSSLRVCATTKKRKACANCSCGLAEELEAEARANTHNAKSSCGNVIN